MWDAIFLVIEMDKCAECGKEFEATPENSVDMKVKVGGSFYATVCKPCVKSLKAQGKIRVLKPGGVQL